jgi:hypothetical protein
MKPRFLWSTIIPYIFNALVTTIVAAITTNVIIISKENRFIAHYAPALASARRDLGMPPREVQNPEQLIDAALEIVNSVNPQGRSKQ